MSKRRGLGRGLGALIPTDSGRKEQPGLRLVGVKEIEPNPHQPRGRMDAEKLDELAASIREHGLIQPLIVTEAGNGRYTLIAGERRWRASQLAGLTELPVVIKEATPQAMLELAIIENVQRADLNAYEEALAYRQLMDEFSLTQEEVAVRMGKARSTIANLVRILELPPEVQQAVMDGLLSGAHTREILRLPTPEMQINATRQAIKLHLSRRQTKTLVDNLLATEKPEPKPKKTLSPELLSLQTQFEQTFGTPVNIEIGKKGGRVVIHYYSDEELNAIYDTIIGE